MCIIIAIPKGKTVEKETLEMCHFNNPDGVGIACSINGKIIVKKSFTLEDIVEYYDIVKGLYPTVIHFRLTSKGTTDIKNIHPFQVHKNLWFCHNGTLSNVKTDKVKSDTVIFNETILRKLQHNFLYNDGIKTMMSDFIGTSKMAFLNNKGEIVIINEDYGKWDDGVWYSNLFYNKSRYTTQTKQKANNTTITKHYGYMPNETNIKKKYDYCERCGKYGVALYYNDSLVGMDYLGVKQTSAMWLCIDCDDRIYDIVEGKESKDVKLLNSGTLCTECGAECIGVNEIAYEMCVTCAKKKNNIPYNMLEKLKEY